MRNRLGRPVLRVDVRLDSTDMVRLEPITNGDDGLRREPVSLIGYADDPGEIRNLADDRRLDEPDRAPGTARANDPVAPHFTRDAGTFGLLPVAAREFDRRRRFTAGEHVERMVGEHRRHLVRITHTKGAQHQTIGLDRREDHLRTLPQPEPSGPVR